MPIVSTQHSPILSHVPGYRCREESPHVLIIGAGVIGLTTAWVLLDRGYRVTILAKNKAANDGHTPRLTSQIAGALWEFPPAVCGHQNTLRPVLDTAARRSMNSYRVFEDIAGDPVYAKEFGVSMMNACFFFEEMINENEGLLDKKRGIISYGIPFRHDAGIIAENGLSTEKYKDAWELFSPVIDTDRAMERMTKLVQDKGAELIIMEIKEDLFDIETSLKEKYKADAIVNASGLGAKVLASDNEVYPLRGGVLRIRNDGQHFKKLKNCLVVSAMDIGDVTSKFIFIVPRSEAVLVAGGFSEPRKLNEAGQDTNQSDPLHPDHELVNDLRSRLVEFSPDRFRAGLHGDTAYPLAHGSRPARHSGDVRVERESRCHPGAEPRQRHSTIIHNYGHAGSGWSLSFGCALDVLVLVEDVLKLSGKSPSAKFARL